MKKKVYYKVVTKANDGRLISSGVCFSAMAFVEYAIGKTSVAPKQFADEGYHLWVFKTLEDAKEYMRICCKFVSGRIYECSAREEVEFPSFQINFPVTNMLEKLDITDWLLEKPPGSMMFKQVTLIKEVV